jgi:hypothetical protein
MFVAGLLLALVAGCGQPPPGPRGAAGATYTCCDPADLAKVYQPGAAVPVRWTAPARPVHTGNVVLTARLQGPYPTEAAATASSPADAAPSSADPAVDPVVGPTADPTVDPAATGGVGVGPAASDPAGGPDGAARGRVRSYMSAPVRPSGAPGERPVTTIPIGSDAAPGFYHLLFTVDVAGWRSGGTSVLRVAG